MVTPVLLFGYGNPSRGDDALGPALLARIEALRPRHPEWPALEFLTDFQLQVEHTLDLRGREGVLFVDADAGSRPPFSFSRISPAHTTGYTTHMLTPPELLQTFTRVLGTPPPPTFLLGIRAERFELGAPISVDAAGNLEHAVAFTVQLLRRTVGEWADAAQGLPGQHRLEAQFVRAKARKSTSAS